MLGCKFLIIGAGETGLHLAKELSLMGESVILVEQDSFGGSYIHYNEIPKFWLKHEANRFVSALEIFRDFDQTFSTLVDYRRAIKDIVEEKIVATYKFFLSDYHNVKNLQIIAGKASFISKNLIQVVSKNENTVENQNQEQKEFITFENLILAIGKNTLIKPNLFKSNGIEFLHQYSAFQFNTVPKSLCVLGCSVQNLEIADIYANLGIKVTILEYKTMSDCFPRLGIDCLEYLKKYFVSKQIEVFFQTQIEHIQPTNKTTNTEVTIDFMEYKDANQTNVFKRVFNSVYTTVAENFTERGLGLGAMGILYDKTGIQTDFRGRTNLSNIWAFGDCNHKTTSHNKLGKVSDFLLKVRQNIRQNSSRQNNKTNLWDTADGGRNDSLADNGQINFAIHTSKPIFCFGLSELETQNIYKPDVDIEIIQKIEQEGFIKLWFRQSSGQILGGCVVGEMTQYRHYISLAIAKNLNIMEVMRYVLSD